MKEIQEALNLIIDYSDREAAERKMNACLNVIGLSVKDVAKCKGNLERAKQKAIARLINQDDKLNSRMLKMFIDSQTIDEQEALELAERSWVGLHKTIDGLKSLLNVQESDLKW